MPEAHIFKKFINKNLVCAYLHYVGLSNILITVHIVQPYEICIMYVNIISFEDLKTFRSTYRCSLKMNRIRSSIEQFIRRWRSTDCVSALCH